MNAIIATKRIVLVLALMLIVSGCSIFTSSNNNDVADALGVKETGEVVDISNLNDQSVNVNVGDIIYLKLVGAANSGRQWTVVSPTGGEYLVLKDHTVTGLNDENAPNGEFTDEWEMLVVKPGEFVVGFDYGVFGKEPESSFSVKINSN